MDGRAFVDGGLTRNLPVDVARDMGADVVIAVNLGTPLGPMYFAYGIAQEDNRSLYFYLGRP